MSNKKEYAIGEEVQIGQRTYLCSSAQDGTKLICFACDLSSILYARACRYVIGECLARNRTDNLNVIFRLKEEQL